MLHPECVSVVSYVISERLWGLQGVVVKKNLSNRWHREVACNQTLYRVTQQLWLCAAAEPWKDSEQYFLI